MNIEERINKILLEEEEDENEKINMISNPYFEWDIHVIKIDNIDCSNIGTLPNYKWLKKVENCKYVYQRMNMSNSNLNNMFYISNAMLIFSTIMNISNNKILDLPEKNKLEYIKLFTHIRNYTNNRSTIGITIPITTEHDSKDLYETIKKVYPLDINLPNICKLYIEEYERIIPSNDNTIKVLVNLNKLILRNIEENLLNTKVVFFVNKITGEKTWKQIPGIYLSNEDITK